NTLAGLQVKTTREERVFSRGLSRRQQRTDREASYLPLSRHQRWSTTRLGWAPVPCAAPGLRVIDDTFQELVIDLQRRYFTLDTRRKSMAVPVYALTRLRAVALAETAIETHERAATDSVSLRERLRGLAADAFAVQFDKTVTLLVDQLVWIPVQRRELL